MQQLDATGGVADPRRRNLFSHSIITLSPLLRVLSAIQLSLSPTPPSEGSKFSFDCVAAVTDSEGPL